MVYDNRAAHKRLHQLAFLLDSLGQALHFKTNDKDDDIKLIVHFAAVRRFDILARSFFDHLALSLQVTIKSYEDGFIDSILMGCKDQYNFLDEEVSMLEIMAGMIAEIHHYDSEEFVEPDDFFDEMRNQYAFMKTILEREFEGLEQGGHSPFSSNRPEKQA